MILPYNNKLKQSARNLRSRMTDAELRLWSKIRRKQVDGHLVSRQRPVGEYIIDFYYAGSQLAIEVDGGQHFSEDGKAYDLEREKFLESLGIRILRFSNSEVLSNTDGVLKRIREVLRELTTPSIPLHEGGQ